MREINNSTGNVNPSNFQKVDSKSDVTQSRETVPENDGLSQAAENLSQSPEAIIGRSQVRNTDNLENDIKVMLNDPEAVQKTLNFCGLAEKVLRENGDEAPYEKASELANVFKDEFLS